MTDLLLGFLTRKIAEPGLARAIELMGLQSLPIAVHGVTGAAQVPAESRDWRGPRAPAWAISDRDGLATHPERNPARSVGNRALASGWVSQQ